MYFSKGREGMAKEWAKFDAEYKKLKPQLQKYKKDRASAVWQRYRIALSNCEEGESNLKESLVDARKEGVTGSSLADFMKSKSFAEAKKLLDKARDDFADEVQALDDFTSGAAELAEKIGKLNVAINKDLKSRRDKSESKKDIEALRDQTSDDYQELTKSAAYKDKPNKYQQTYLTNYDKMVKQAIKIAPEEAKQRKTDTELPQLIVDRKLKSNLNKAVAMKKKIDEACDAAFMAASDDLKAAAPHLKIAQAQFKELKELDEDYEAVAKRYKVDIEVSKDKAKIEKAMQLIAKAHEDAARKLRGTVTTLKKAG